MGKSDESAAGEDAVLHAPADVDVSDAEGSSERTTREKLKKTSIAGLHEHTTAAPARPGPAKTEAEEGNGNGNGSENGSLRGRPSKKRSFEDLHKDDDDAGSSAANGSAELPDPKRGSYHKRMRSRDVDHVDAPQREAASKATDEHGGGSPVREESDEEALSTPGGAGVLVDANSQSDSNAQVENAHKKTAAADAESEVPRPPPQAQSAATTASAPSSALSPSSGFANASSTSPFGAVAAPQKEREKEPAKEAPAKTSSSAFASSGLSAFASSEKSPFGAAATKPSTSGFGAPAASTGFGSTSTGFGGASSSSVLGSKTTSAFGGASSSSVLGSKTTSAFGGASSSSVLGSKTTSAFGGGASSGFGSASGFGSSLAPRTFGSTLASFASPAGSKSVFGKSKPFGGAKDEDKEDGSDQDADAEEQQGQEEENDDSKPDSRFHEQEVETGEESERVEFQARARLYHFDKEWKERGTGNIKINTRYEVKAVVDEGDAEAGGDLAGQARKARVVMRADGVHRVILNSPIFKGMKCGTNEGKPPVGRTMYLTGLEEGQPRLFQIKIGKEDVLREFYDKIEELKADLE